MNHHPSTHPLNVSYLVVGLIFLGIAGSWALLSSGVVDTDGLEWLIPAVLVAAGAIGLVAFAAKGISRSRHADDSTSYDTDYEPYPTYDAPPGDETTTQLDTTAAGDDR